MIATGSKSAVLGAALMLVLFGFVKSKEPDGSRSDRFAALQFAPSPGDVAGNRAKLAHLIEEAARKGARYIVIPELSLTGSLKDEPVGRRFREAIPGPSTNHFAEQARRLGIWIGVSIVEGAENSEGHHLTSVLLDDTGAIVFRHRKVVPRINGNDGPGLIRGSPGAVLTSLDDHGRRIGIVSGDDIQTGVPRLAGRGADTVLVTANWTPAEQIDWKAVCSQLSRTYRVNLVIANTDRALGGIYLRDGGLRLPAVGPEGNSLVKSIKAPDPRFRLEAPLGLPSIPFPTNYEVTPQMVDLGREIFFDPSFSSDGKVSCATCHMPGKAFSNGEVKGFGVYGKNTRRNVPTLLNVAYRETLAWHGLSSSLENQMKYPMSHIAEMNFHYLDLVERVKSNPRYMKKLGVAPERVDFDLVSAALANYQRTLISGNSPFDRFYYSDEADALGASAQRGLRLFTGKANCSNCHQISPRDALFMDHSFHNTGVGYDPKTGTFSDLGAAEIAFERESGFFSTPTLRNVAETAPYMHDGSIPTLRGVIEFYNAGGNPNPFLDTKITPLNLDDQEIEDLVVFLRSLTGVERYSESGEKVMPEKQTQSEGKED